MNEEERLKLRVPVWCPHCSGPMKGRSTLTYYRWHCCMTCFIEFIDGREERWTSGWRPSIEEMQAYEDKYNPSPYNSSKLPNL